jgi:hypothetical protein
MHFIAIKHLLHARGGNESTKKLPQREIAIIMATYITMIRHEDCLFPKISGMESAKRKLTDILRTMARWNNTLPGRETGKEAQAYTKPFSTGERIEDVFQIRCWAFSNTSPLFNYIQPKNPQDNIEQKIIHFLVLYNINLALWELRYSKTRSAAFITNIFDDVKSSMKPGVQMPQLQSIAVVLIVLFRASEAIEENGREDALWRLLEMLDVVRIMLLLSQDFWDEITTMLSHWLTGDAEDLIITDATWEAIDVGITTSWLHKKGYTNLPKT